MYSYFMTQRPPMPGAMPRDGLVDIEEYDSREYRYEIMREAWAKLVYSRELTRQEMSDYELVPGTYSGMEV